MLPDVDEARAQEILSEIKQDRWIDKSTQVGVPGLPPCPERVAASLASSSCYC